MKKSSRLKYAIDLSLWTLAAPLAFWLRIGETSVDEWRHLLVYGLTGFMLKAALIWHYRLYRQTWGRVGVRDLYALGRAVAAGTLTLLAFSFLLTPLLVVPRSTPIIEGVLALLFLGGARVVTRSLNERQRQRQRHTEGLRLVLIVGAGEAGVMIAREMLRHPEAGLLPIGFLDDEPTKRRTSLVGLPVLGTVKDLVGVAKQRQADEVLIAAPSAPGHFVRRVVDLAREAGVGHRIMPGVFEILSGQVAISQIREVKLEDLLRREPVRLNTDEIAGFLRGRVVLVTGAGGSIGSEIVRQIVRFLPKEVILFGRGENSVFQIQQELLRDWPEIAQVALIGDVRDRPRLREVFRIHRPEVVFHAAAHKHVPLMEFSPGEAILNNVLGTLNVAELSLEHRVRRLVNISTDKAVNPTSVMGASKRVAEMVISAVSARAEPDQAFVSVRFGNVLGSRGSVVPTFLSQIRAGGPITLTHPEMRRYFMTIPEASRLVLQAGGLAENGRTYMLNMGEPVKIADLAHDLIRLSGAQDIEVVYSGMRPGEKLYEELLTPSENVDATRHSEIFTARLSPVDVVWIGQQVAELAGHARAQDGDAIRRLLHQLIPENKFGHRA